MTQGQFRMVRFQTVYEEAFVQRSHELVGLGYARLTRICLGALDETDITGQLVDAMEAALDAQDRPEWATQFTTIDDEPRSIAGRTGRRRPRVDVTIRCICPRPSTSFRFEAKRLRCDTSLSNYLGNSGLLALVTGYYGVMPWSGMLGYVQTGTCSFWSGRIKEGIESAPAKYFARTPVKFSALGVSISEPVFCSEHEYGANPSLRHVTHTLLACA